MKTWVKVAAVVGAVVLVGVLAVGYLGFVPFLSDLMGTNKATDLGVKYTAADAESATTKLSDLLNSPEDTTVTLSEAEITAFINEKAAESDKIPIDNTQVKIGADGTLQITGNIDMAKLQTLGSSGDVDESAKSLINTVTSVVRTDPSFSTKASLSVVDGKPVADISDLKLGNLGLTPDQTAAGEEMISKMLEGYMSNSGMSFTELQASSGSLTIGTTKTP